MLEVQKFLQLRTDKYGPLTFTNIEDVHIAALEDLKGEFGIKYNIWNNELVVLNYDQIESSKYKFHPIVRECRSLVLELGSWSVVSRSFDRFYNLTESPEHEDLDLSTLTAHEKIDGSLITVFNYNDKWLYRTKSMIMPESVINENLTGTNWRDRIEEALGSSYKEYLDKRNSYIGELTCKENRVVVKYNETSFYLLAVRENLSGEYL